MSSNTKGFSHWLIKTVLFFIILLSFCLRFYQLGDIPVGFHRDEAYLGYNAYSILQTGKDLTNNYLPLHLQSFLFSPAGYSYFSIPLIALFGLNEFAVRLPSALFGSLTVLLTFFLVRSLFIHYEVKKNNADVLALLSAFFLAIAPWHINLSRVATENVIVVFLITVGIVLYIKWIETKKVWLLLICFLCFGGTLLVYQAPRAFLPFFLPLLFIFLPPKPLKKNFILPLILFLSLIILPTICILTSHDLSQRIRMLSIFHHPETQLVLNEQIREDGTTHTPLMITRIFHNKAVNYSSTFLQNYFKHFSYEFLFTDQGFPDRYRVSQMGLLYPFELPLLLVGLITLFVRYRRIGYFLFGWIVLAPIGSAMTFDDVPNLQRTLIVFPALSILTAVGFLQIWGYIKSLRGSFVMKILLIGIIIFSIGYYLHQYFIHQVLHRPWYRQEGYKQLIEQINKFPQYKKVVITDAETEPGIFFLFFNHYDPAAFQKDVDHKINAKGIKGFENYQFVHEECPLREIATPDQRTGKVDYLLNGEKNTIYVNHIRCEISQNKVNTLAEIKRSDDSRVFLLQTLDE